MEKSEHAKPDGVLLPTPGAEPTKFMIDRECDKYPTTYAARRAQYAIERTELFIATLRDSVVNDHPFVKRVLAANADDDRVWTVEPRYNADDQPKNRPADS
jgi:hypothetical protein